MSREHPNFDPNEDNEVAHLDASMLFVNDWSDSPFSFSEFGGITNEEPLAGSMTFKNAPVWVQESPLFGFDMLLGMDFLRSSKVWLSYRTGQVFMQYVGRAHATPAAVNGAQPGQPG
ncbi:hypothetical protein B0G69_6608 [Paraburkholderia sp. RAU2J]|uniref:hypothetical protein n=1 Tax=Paraburkholderia sp. RAU2J TaxID=1938810 RepID=UPI000EAFE2E3|nr:hypothetical protein [Paraburkholderia sp. RAU2J]RKT13455.1 hypothetical protein B0G69_6608 [Paraburkholderia sp. RAU2J]